LAVGGSGNGGKDYSGGGGGGGVVLATVILPIGSDTKNITIGNGQPKGFIRGGTGRTTYISFVKNTSLNLIAGGGGNGQIYGYAGSNGSINGGSGGGGSLGTGGVSFANNSNNNLANGGGSGSADNRNQTPGEGGAQGGGGGAGSRGDNAPIRYDDPQANGVQCNLLGIKLFGQYGSYYWGIGGGAGNGNGYGGNSGLGGGGGGSSENFNDLGTPSTVLFRAGLGGTNALNNGTDGLGRVGEDAGLNTGSGGGGGSVAGNSGGSGGSGIVIVAFK
jgi:hypothetical protein